MKNVVRRKNQFDEVMNDDTIQSTKESFLIDYFLFVIEQAIYLLHSRFDQFTKYENIFSFLYDLKKYISQKDDGLKEYCVSLETFLKHDIFFDIDGLDLLSELKVLKEIIQVERNTPIEILNYIKRLDSFPNA